MRDVDVIIVSWRCLPVLRNCLRSLEEAGTRCSVRTVVVDNASGDETVAAVRSGYPAVEVRENPSNVGFAAANNQVIRASDARHLLLLNPDTVVKPGLIDAMVQFMDARPAAWACGPATLNTDGTPQRPGVRFPSFWNLVCETFFLDRLAPRSRLFGRHRGLYEDPRRARQVDYVQGSCLMVRREAVERAGLLDEGYFMYFEEADWCRRMKDAGGEVWYAPVGEVIHLGAAEPGHFDARRLVHYHRGLLRFFRKHRPPWMGLPLRLLVVVRSLMRIMVWSGVALVRPARRGAALSAIRGYLSCILLMGGLRSA